ncbi:MAG: hypothetical protein IKD69_15060 [Solobacterium sp.]|nr:hypothetical protein [Solobacterium sp.]
MGFGERAGSGVPDIFAVWAANGYKEPIVEEEFNPDRTILTLPLLKKEVGKTIEIAKDSEQDLKNRTEKTGRKKQDEKASRKNGDE